jgi:hypothetical protein
LLRIAGAVGAAVGAEAGFELEQRLQTAAQIFRALQADARAGLDTGAELGHTAVAVAVVGNAHVDDAIQLHAVSCVGGAGEGTEDSQRDERFFHLVHLQKIVGQNG